MALTSAQEKLFAQSVAEILASLGTHGLATSSLQGLGEVSLRDATIVAAASVGAQLKQAWILLREEQPASWSKGNVDVVVARTKGAKTAWVTGVELKWWRHQDAANSFNRRRDLIRDFIRCASIYPALESPAIVALLATTESWKKTTGTKGADQPVMDLLKKSGMQSWSVAHLATSKALREAASNLKGSVCIASHFRSRRVATIRVRVNGEERLCARTWKVWKHQNTHWLTSKELETLWAAA